MLFKQHRNNHHRFLYQTYKDGQGIKYDYRLKRDGSGEGENSDIRPLLAQTFEITPKSQQV